MVTFLSPPFAYPLMYIFSSFTANTLLVLGIEKHTVSNFRCSYPERYEQRKFETVCFSIPNTVPVAQKSALHLLLSVPAVLLLFFCTVLQFSLWCSALATRF